MKQDPVSVCLSGPPRSSTKPSDDIALGVIVVDHAWLDEVSYVYFCGSPIGKVTNLTILPNRKILVEIEIDHTFEPTANDEFALVNSDFIGTQVIEIFPGVPGGDRYTRKDTITGTITDRSPSQTPDLLAPLDSVERRVLYDSLIAPHIKKDQ